MRINQRIRTWAKLTRKLKSYVLTTWKRGQIVNLTKKLVVQNLLTKYIEIYLISNRILKVRKCQRRSDAVQCWVNTLKKPTAGSATEKRWETVFVVLVFPGFLLSRFWPFQFPFSFAKFGRFHHFHCYTQFFIRMLKFQLKFLSNPGFWVLNTSYLGEFFRKEPCNS